MKKLKYKIIVGLISILFVIFLLSLTGIISIYYLSKDSAAIIRDNYTSVDLSTNMLEAIDAIYSYQLLINEAKTNGTGNLKSLKDSLIDNKIYFEKNLNRQKNHIAEPGEAESVEKLLGAYNAFLLTIERIDNNNLNVIAKEFENFKSTYSTTVSAIRELNKINMDAIFKKNIIASKTADSVTFYMAIAAAVSTLIMLLFIFYFPSYITSPLTELTKKIEEISNKKYDQRIEIKSSDELSTLALAFNKMAVKLKEYETQHIDELLLEKRRMETLLVNLQDATVLLDSNLRINHVNRKFCELIGKSVTELLGKKINEIEKGNEVLTFIQSLDFRKEDVSLTGKSKPVEIIVNDQKEYYQVLLLDIHRGIRAETSGEPSEYILLIQNVTAYEERDLAKTNLLATISHELKTPISSINLSIKLLEDARIGVLNEEQKRLTQALKLHSSRILNLVNEVLDFAQAETGHIKPVIKTYNVSEIIDLGTIATYMLLNEKEIHLDVIIPDNLPKVKCDLEKTVWVVVNILSNAARYSPQNGKIIIDVSNENNFVVISIKDEGPGISKEYQKAIFERYVKSESLSVKGTGLGLAIAKEFVEVQGGIIGVQSSPGEGSNFYFTIPAA